VLVASPLASEKRELIAIQDSEEIHPP